ncbi:MAG: hypothetical protein ABIH03_08350 [Pseudomonadota bacterium]
MAKRKIQVSERLLMIEAAVHGQLPDDGRIGLSCRIEALAGAESIQVAECHAGLASWIRQL